MSGFDGRYGNQDTGTADEDEQSNNSIRLPERSEALIPFTLAASTRAMDLSPETVTDHPYAVRYRRARRRFFHRRRRPGALADLLRYRRRTDVAAVAPMVALSLGFAALTGVAAQVRVLLPFSPVPITGQTFAVLLAGVALGWRYGGLSQGLYAAIGAAGVPWFAGGGAGVGVLLGPTGGYVVGFVLAAVFVGYLTDYVPRLRRFRYLVVVLAVVNFGVIHLLGASYLGVYGWLFEGTVPTIESLLVQGVLPFVPGDVAKLVLVAGIGSAVVPGGSLDSDPERATALDGDHD